MKKIWSVILAAALAVSVTGCSASSGSAGKASGYQAKKVTLTYVKSPLNVPSIVEKEKGLLAAAYKKYGVSVEYANLTTGPEQTQALASGDVQFLYAVGATSVITAAAGGADVKIISMYSRSPKAFEIFTKNKNIQSAADLKGKKIAGPKGTILHELLVAYLKTAGLTQKDVNFVSMDIPSSQAALESGSVDAALLAGANAYNEQKAGARVLTTGENLVDGTIAVATSQKFYNANKPLVNVFLKTQKETLEYVQSHHADAMALTAKATGLSGDAVESMFPLYDFNPTTRESDITSMKHTEEFLKSNDMISKDVDVSGLILK